MKDHAESKGWTFVIVEHLKTNSDVLVSSLQSKYIKFLAFLDNFEGFTKYRRLTYFDHKFFVQSKHLDWITENSHSDADILIRETPRFKGTIGDEVRAAMGQERYRRNMDATLHWIDNAKVSGAALEEVRICNTGIIHYQNIQRARKLTDKLYQIALDLQQPECQILWAVLSQSAQVTIQIVRWADLNPVWKEPSG